MFNFVRKDKLSKFMHYLPSPDRIVGWGIVGGLSAVVFGALLETSHTGGLTIFNGGGRRKE